VGNIQKNIENRFYCSRNALRREGEVKDAREMYKRWSTYLLCMIPCFCYSGDVPTTFCGASSRDHPETLHLPFVTYYWYANIVTPIVISEVKRLLLCSLLDRAMTVYVGLDVMIFAGLELNEVGAAVWWCTIVLKETLGYHPGRLGPAETGVALHLVWERKSVVWYATTILQRLKLGVDIYE